MSKLNSEKIASHIIDWLANYIVDLPVNGFIVGISGGVDSALVATLCAETRREVILLNMPIHQTDTEYNRAKNQIKFLEDKYKNVKGLEVDLTKTFDVLTETFP